MKRKASSKRNVSRTPSCSKKRKAECLQSPDCTWFVGYGCRSNTLTKKSKSLSPPRTPVFSKSLSLSTPPTPVFPGMPPRKRRKKSSPKRPSPKRPSPKPKTPSPPSPRGEFEEYGFLRTFSKSPKDSKSPKSPELLKKDRKQLSPLKYDTSPINFKLYAEEEMLEALVDEIREKPKLKPFWFKHNEELRELINIRSLEFLSKNFEEACLIPGLSILTRLRLDEEKDKYIISDPNKIPILFDCIKNPKKQIIGIYVSVHKENHRTGHRLILIINKAQKSIELYDSNGWNYHENVYGDRVVNLIQEFIDNVLKLDYAIFYPQDVCPRISFQAYQAHYKLYKGVIKKIGLCTLWSLFTLHLRIKYYKMDPEEFLKSINETIQKITENKTKKEAKEKLKRLFSDFIMNYALYLKYILDYVPANPHLFPES